MQILHGPGLNYTALSFLLKHGANINQTNDEGETVLYLAARRGDPKLVKFLIDNKADVNIRTRAGRTAVIIAMSHYDYPSYQKVIDALKKAGAVMPTEAEYKKLRQMRPDLGD